MPAEPSRPAFYALAAGGWRDAVTILHPPYTAWHLSYYALGAALAPRLHVDRLLWGLAAFALAVGVGAHALDELRGRPLGTGFADATLIGAAALALIAAVAIGVAGVIVVSALLIPLVIAGAFIAVAYNLELFGGRFHGDFWFAAAWGGLPALTGYVAEARGLDLAGALVALACVALSLAQRRLSTPVRGLRRRTRALTGVRELTDGTREPLTVSSTLAPLEAALSALSYAMVLLAAAAVASRL